MRDCQDIQETTGGPRQQDIRPSLVPGGRAEKTASANSLSGSVLIRAVIAINGISANVLIAVIIISSSSGTATDQEGVDGVPPRVF